MCWARSTDPLSLKIAAAARTDAGALAGKLLELGGAARAAPVRSEARFVSNGLEENHWRLCVSGTPFRETKTGI